MPRPEKKDFPRLLPDSQRLVFLSREISKAASRPESRSWENQMEQTILKLLRAKKQHKLDDAIEYLYKTDLDAYNILLEAIEALSESCVIEHEGVAWTTLLVVAPVLAWTRFSIPSGKLPKALHDGLMKGLAERVFAENARLMLAPDLYAIDQLPYSHIEVFSLMKGMANTLLGKPESLVFKKQETASFLADVRYLVAAVQVPLSHPLFRWQTDASSGEYVDMREICRENWKQQAISLLSNMLLGCALDVTLPDAFFGGCRAADQQIRPASVHAAVHYLTHALDIPVTDLRAVIGGFTETPHQESITEYRIGFSLRENNQILYGVVWPVYGTEEMQQTLKQALHGAEAFASRDAPKSPLAQILTLLSDLGVKCEKNHLERFPMEFCDECGAPLFADINAELVHAELPESARKESQLH